MAETKTETKHTPTPYMVQRLNHADGETWIQIGFMDGGREIGPLAELVGGAVKHDAPVWHPVAVMKYLVASDAQVLANAEFIVRACNSYDVLLDALRKFGRHAESCDFNKYLPGVVKTAAGHCDCGLVAAINKAEGKP